MKKELNIIGFDFSASGSETFTSYNPVARSHNEDLFVVATDEEVDLAAKKAATAFQIYRKKSGAEKADFLLAIADEIMNAGDELITVCSSETGLPAARLQGERGRTVGQLKMFAALLQEGSWVDARIETALPDRTPLPKPDIRYMHTALGPVAVFGASNFPLAFSVAGGDTVSALAAGCPVVVKSHPAHPGTSAIVGKAIVKAAKNTNMPDGVFSLLYDNGIGAGIQLVKHPSIKAVGFTGSFKAGKALFDAAVSRPEPIPVYAEMGSANPVFVLPQAMKERGAEIATGYMAALTLGVGQFCTNPGLLIHQISKDNFTSYLKNAIEKTVGGVMLTPAILKAYNAGVHHSTTTAGVLPLGFSNEQSGSGTDLAVPVVLTTDFAIFEKNSNLSEEIFGPTGMVVPVASKAEMLKLAENLSGHLTATVHGTEAELLAYRDLLNILEQKVGRVVINGFPTGVEVCSAMVHGGPFPATTDSKTTSVGTAAIYRFTRPVCYQNMPQALLPAELQNNNALHIFRLINGAHSNQDIN